MRRLKLLVFAMLLNIAAMAQAQRVTGTVTDSKTGAPLPAVTIKVKGKPTQTVADASGNFAIVIPAGSSTLEFSYVGYATKTVEVTGTTLSVALDPSSSNSLTDVVVTALGINKEARKVGYAVSTVAGDELSKDRTPNVALGLEGEVAGLNVKGTNGGPGGSARILLRGVSSLNSGGDPLFVVNGQPIDNTQRGAAGEWGGTDNGDGIGNINPDDIETMTVLKGLAATALYGARATNGAILITTKSGKKTGLNVEYNGNYIADRAVNNTDFQYVYGQGTGGTIPLTQAASQATARFAWGAKMDGSSFTGWNGKTYNYSPYEDNMKDFYQTGGSFTNTVSVSGAGERGNFRLSGSNLNNNAIVKNSGLGRTTFNLALDQKITDKLSVNLNSSYVDQTTYNPPNLSDGPGNPNNGMFLAPNIKETTLAPGYDANGNEVVFSDDNYVTNPYFVINKWITNIQRKRFINALSTKYNFNSWLFLQGRLGYDIENDRNFNITPTGTNYSINSAGQSGSINLTTSQTSELNLDLLLGVSHKIVKNLNLDATLGGNQRHNKNEAVGISGGPFVIPDLYTPGNVLTYGRSYSFYNKEVHSGFYSVDLTYKNYLTLSTTGRYDAYSTLYNSEIPKGQRNIFTPSVSGSFIFSQLTHIPALSYGKLRVSYSEATGEPVNPYQTAVYYSVGNAINGTSTGSFSSTLPNLFLKPYTLSEFEVGTELKFLDNRLGIDVSYFTRESHKEIMNATLSSASGYTGSVVANGSIKNSGVEVLITGTPIKSRNFSWNISLNGATLANKVLKTDDAGNNLTLGTYRPLNANTAWIVGMSGPQIMAHDYTRDSKGDIVVNSAGLPIQGNLIPMGSVMPTLYGGLKNEFNYKNFNFSFLIDYNFGNKVLSATSYYALYRGLDKRTLVGREGGIVVNGVTADGTANTTTASAEAYYEDLASISRVNVLNGNYIKLRQVGLGYTFGGKGFDKIPLFSAIQVSLVGRNLWTIMKKADNIDPESGFNPSVNYAGIEGTSLPAIRSYGINANFKFKK